MQLPPPIHGASTINDIIAKSELLDFHFNKTVINISTASSISEIGYFTFNKVIKSFSLYYKVIHSLLFAKAQICYITLSPTGLGFWKDSVLVLLCKIFKKKIIIHFHGRGIKEFFFLNKVNKFYYKLVCKNTYLIFLSNKLSNDFPTDYVSVKKYFFLNNCLSKDDFDLKKEFNSNSKLRLLFLSNLIKDKGVLEFLEICRLLSTNKINYTGKIVGKEFDITGDYINEFLIKHSLKENLQYCGPLYNQKKEEVLLNSDILILPTKNDAFPLVILEAFKFGVVPLSVNIGGIADIIENNKTGFCFEDNKPEYFVETIKLLHQNRALLNNMANNCMNEFKSKYTIDKFETNFIHIMNEVYKLEYE
jgi:glycosyltransferase involved in cell wall biosynthesis